MTARRPKIAIVAGEQSGQLLAFELIQALTDHLGEVPELVGVGGGELEQLGLQSVFDAHEIALTGITSVLKTLPRLVRRIGQTVDAVVDAKPDCLLLVDSPDFSLRVAKRVKARMPDLPVIKYVAPTVWAWRPQRAAKMKEFVDHVLAILPFEPEVMERLDGPKTHFVGHRLVAEEALAKARTVNFKKKRSVSEGINLLVLPGSRNAEIKSLLDDFGQVVEILQSRGHKVTTYIPTLPRHLDEVRRKTAAWRDSPIISITREDQVAAYETADAAIAASGTVLLELALAGVPVVSCYKLDPIMKQMTSMLTAWTAALPNLIADRPIIREFYNEQIRPGMVARCVEDLSTYGSPARLAVMQGYEEVLAKMQTDQPASAKAASIVADILAQEA